MTTIWQFWQKTPSAVVQFITATEDDKDLKKRPFHDSTQSICNWLYRGIVDKDVWHWEEYILKELVMSVPLFQRELCDFSQDESNVLVQSFCHMFANTLNEMTLGGKNTFGYLVTVVLEEWLPSERNGSVVYKESIHYCPHWQLNYMFMCV